MRAVRRWSRLREVRWLRAALLRLAPALALALLAGCGGGGAKDAPFSGAATIPAQAPEAPALGIPYLATKNTTRVPGADPTTDAAAVADAVYPSQDRGSRPSVVALVNSNDVGGALAASVLVAAPLKAAILFSNGSTLPQVSAAALKALRPTGSSDAGDATVIRVGDVAQPSGVKTTDIIGHDPVSLAAAIDRFQTSTAGEPSSDVMVVSTDAPEFGMAAAAFAARSGDSILLVTKDGVPPATRAAIAQHASPNIYEMGPVTVIGKKVTSELRKLGTVRRITGTDPASVSTALARYHTGKFGWNIDGSPGHGFVFAAASRPLDAVAATALSNSGTYGPLLVLPRAAPLAPALADYLYRNQPGYRRDPTTSFYNHGWVIGDQGAITLATQTTIDRLLEPVPVSSASQ